MDAFWIDLFVGEIFGFPMDFEVSQPFQDLFSLLQQHHHNKNITETQIRKTEKLLPRDQKVPTLLWNCIESYEFRKQGLMKPAKMKPTTTP